MRDLESILSDVQDCDNERCCDIRDLCAEVERLRGLEAWMQTARNDQRMVLDAVAVLRAENAELDAEVERLTADLVASGFAAHALRMDVEDAEGRLDRQAVEVERLRAENASLHSLLPGAAACADFIEAVSEGDE